MARIVNNDKGFKVIALSPVEVRSLGWGCSEGLICMNCNGIIKKEAYYVAVLNDVMDKKCYEEWLKSATYYSDDKPVEDRNFNYYAERLGLN